MATSYPVPPTVPSTDASPPPAAASTPSPQEASAAFARIEPELASLDPRELVRITSDVGKSVSMGLGAVPGMMALRAEIVRRMPEHPIDALDKLSDYALAAWYAHILANTIPSEDTLIQTLHKEAIPLRARLLVCAEGFAHFGIFDVARVDEVRGGTGYLDAATDLVALAAMFREKWALIASKALVEKHEIDRASQLGTELLMAHGARVQPSAEATPAEAADRRVRAFTLFLNAYDVCRQAVSYVRWKEGDADRIAPSVFVRARGRRAVETEPVAPLAAVAPAAVAPPAVVEAME